MDVLSLSEPLFVAVLCVIACTVAGAYPVRMVIRIKEAQTEMRAGSTSVLRRMRGWSFIALWAVLTGYAGSFVGDWLKTGDLDGALARAGDRLRVIIEILALIMAADQ